MKTQKIYYIIAVATLVGALMSSVDVFAQLPKSGRTELQRHDLSNNEWEVVQVRVDIMPGVTYPKHTHPGEEIVYVLKGVLEYQVEGKLPVTLKAGEVLFIPSGAIHTAKNVGATEGSELATYIVSKRKPLVMFHDEKSNDK